MADNVLYRKKAGGAVGEVEQTGATIDPATGDLEVAGKINGVTIDPNTGNITTDGQVNGADIPEDIEAAGNTLKVSSDDTSPSVLEDKVDAGIGLLKEVLNEGANEQLQLNLSPQIVALTSSGLHTGAQLSVGGVLGTFDITGGEGTYIDSATDFSDIQAALVTITPRTDIPVINIATQPVTYILIDKDDNIIQNTNYPTPAERRDNIFIGVVVHSDNVNVSVVNNVPTVAIDALAQLQDLYTSLGFFNESGNLISPNGANLSFNKSSGTAIKAGANFSNNKKDPHTLSLASAVGATFRYRNQDGSEDSDVAVLDPTTYDVGGTTTAIGGSDNQATLQRVYIFPSNAIRVQRGQEIFSSLADAINAVGREVFVTEQNIAENGLLLATIAITKGCEELNNSSEAQIFTASKFGELGSVGSSSTGTLQQTYDNSTANPEILTTDVNGALTIRRGTSGDDSDIVVEVQNNAGTITFSIDGNGNITTNGTVDGRDISADGVLLDGKLDKDLILEAPPVGSYTLVNADAGKLKRINGPLVIPTGLTVNKQFSVYQINASKQTITSTGVTLEGKPEANISGEGVIAIAITATNTALVKGDTEV